MKIKGQLFTAADVVNMVNFINHISTSYYAHMCCDVDGGDIQEWLEGCELIQEDIATAEDAAEEWAQDWDIQEGETYYRLSDLAKKIAAVVGAK